MAYSRKTTRSRRSSAGKKTYTKRYASSSRKRASPKAQTIRLELHHVMQTPTPVNVPVVGGPGLMPDSKRNQPKL